MSTECYTKWPHIRFVHSKLHEMATQSLCPQNVTRNGHVVAVSTASYTKWPQVAVSTECYTKWPHSRCVHRMLHEMATQSPCPQNVTRNGHIVAVSTECYIWSHTYLCCPQNVTTQSHTHLLCPQNVTRQSHTICCIHMTFPATTHAT